MVMPAPTGRRRREGGLDVAGGEVGGPPHFGAVAAAAEGVEPPLLVDGHPAVGLLQFDEQQLPGAGVHEHEVGEAGLVAAGVVVVEPQPAAELREVEHGLLELGLAASASSYAWSTTVVLVARKARHSGGVRSGCTASQEISSRAVTCTPRRGPSSRTGRQASRAARASRRSRRA
jgi:hypothetical protein